LSDKFSILSELFSVIKCIDNLFHGDIFQFCHPENVSVTGKIEITFMVYGFCEGG
jgi:hypothetical protein